VPTPSTGLQTATFHCDQCGADTLRQIGRMKQAASAGGGH
jgi:hypothetical protein